MRVTLIFNGLNKRVTKTKSFIAIEDVNMFKYYLILKI